jgi:hypothetical protein
MPDNHTGGLPARGKTYLSGPNRTPDSTATQSKGIEGIVKVFKDVDYSVSGGVNQLRSVNDVTCIFVRNSSGVALLPKRLVTWKSGQRGKQVDGYARLDWTDVAGVVDEWLPTAGVAANDYFWLVVKGPTLCTTAASGDALNVIGVDDNLVSLTAAASTHSTTSGRVQSFVVGGTTNITAAYSQILNTIGKAMSAKTTANTNADVLVYTKLI